MTDAGFKRKLTAIFSADVVGYSRLMGEDEAATVKTLETYKGVMFSLIKQHRGRVVDSTGDNLLAEFGSVVDAVQSAVGVQKELQARDAELPENRRMQFRIGINLGDVIEEEDRLYGDGVNIAARLEALADPGGICVSKTAFDHIESKLPLGYKFLGEQTVKNITKPVGAYKVLMETRVIDEDEKASTKGSPFRRRKAALTVGIVVILTVVAGLIWSFYFRPPPMEVASKEKMAFPLPDKPSIAVLPFTNMGSEPKNEYLADGITEGIITALSQVPGMFVIARNSTFTYKGKPVKVQRVSEELGVRYVLEGSVQVSGEKLRVNAQLIDTIRGHHLWAQRYDRDIKDIFALQDEITMMVITELQIKLTENQQAKIGAKGTNNLAAYLKYLQGWHHFQRMTPDDLIKAKNFFEEAIQLDPKYIIAYSRLASVHAIGIRVGLTKNPKAAIALAFELAQKAYSIDESNPYTYVALAGVYREKGQWDKAISLMEKSVALSPNDGALSAALGMNLYFGGNPEESIPLFKRAMRLDPHNPMRYTMQGQSYRALKKYDEAVPFLEKSLRLAPRNIITLMNLAACYIGVGRLEDAKATVEKILEINPKMNVEIWMKRLRCKDQESMKTWGDLLRKAGLPDKPPMKLPSKPSIAVLPFTNMSGDPKQEYFSDGITEDIITNLSKLSGLFVISRNSSFLYKGKKAKIQDVARDLGVRYVLEGSVRRGGNKVRITAQLIDGKTDQHVWADSYDRELKYIFSIQDDVTQKVVAELAIALTGTETERMFRKHTKNFEAYDLYLRGSREMRVLKKENFLRAKELFERVIELDPNFAGGYANLSYLLSRGVRFGYSTSPREDVEKSFELAQKAVSVDNTFWISYHALANVYLMKKRYDDALAAITSAVRIQPGTSDVYLWLGFYLHWMGRGGEAVQAIKKARLLNPKYLNSFHPGYLDFLGYAYFTAGRYEDSVAAWEKAIDNFGPVSVRQAFLAASYSELGRGEEARAVAQQLVADNPKFSLTSWKLARVYKNPEDTERLLKALSKTGLK